MKKLMLIVGAALISGCCTVGSGPKNSGTTFAKDALAPYVENGQLPGAINVFYKDGLQETACVGYADVAAKRPLTMNDVYMQCSQTKGFCGVTVAMLVEEAWKRLRPGGRLVTACNSIENLAAVHSLLRARATDAAYWMVNIARGVEQLDRIRFESLNPSFLIAATKPARL